MKKHDVTYECPACGGRALLLKATYLDGRIPSAAWLVECESRECGFCTGEFADPNDAIDLWRKATGEET
jgi:hypothetical protein